VVDDVSLQSVGLWGASGSGLPDPSALVDESWSDADRDLVAEHVARGFVARAYMGHASCRICGQQIGSLELSDGTYTWPEGLRHYVTVHSVRLPDPFVAHIRAFSDEIESADRDETWWRSLTE
jgi:hypothetical protein